MFAALGLAGIAASTLYVSSVSREQPGASAATGVLDAVDDTAATDPGVPVVIDVDVNDSGEGDITSYAVVAGPTGGSVGAFDVTTATVEYTPDPGFFGTDSFTYAVDETPGVAFDTGALSTGAGAAPGATDAAWTATLDGGAVAPATVIAADPTWSADPFGVAGWICDATCASGSRVTFTRPFQIVDQATADTLVLALDLSAADRIVDVSVNGISLAIPAAASVSMVADPASPAVGWVVGTNTISVIVENDGTGPMGFMAAASAGDHDADNVADATDRCPTTPAGATVNDLGCRREQATVTIEVTDPAILPGGVCGQLVNRSFEDPVLDRSWRNFADARVAGWTSTAGSQEFWRNGMQGVPAIDGNQFAELNSTRSNTIFQDIPTTPGETIAWSFSHRGRTGVDVMRFLAGPPTATGEPTLTMLVEASTDRVWETYSGSYVVPAGQTTTRFAFANVSSANGRASYGNLIDDVSLGDRCATPATTTTTAAPTTTTTSTTTTTTTVPDTTTTSTTVPDTTTTSTTVPDTTTTSTTVPDGTTTTSTTVPDGTTTTSTTVPDGSTTTTSTTTVPDSTTTTSSTTVPATSTTDPEVLAPGAVTDGPDGDGDGVADNEDPTPLIDVQIRFDSVERTTTEIHDGLTYELTLGNNGVADAHGTQIAITPPSGVLIESWSFESWVASGELADAAGAGVLFDGLADTSVPTCWLDAAVLRCELGTVVPGWELPLVVEMTVFDDPGEIDTDATITALGHDVDLDNNADRLGVAARTSLSEAIPEALAFTGVNLGIGWWLLIATTLIGTGTLALTSSRRRLLDV